MKVAELLNRIPLNHPVPVPVEPNRGTLRPVRPEKPTLRKRVVGGPEEHREP